MDLGNDLMSYRRQAIAWTNDMWRHQMEAFSALLALCAGIHLTGEFRAQGASNAGFDVFFDVSF